MLPPPLLVPGNLYKINWIAINIVELPVISSWSVSAFGFYTLASEVWSCQHYICGAFPYITINHNIDHKWCSQCSAYLLFWCLMASSFMHGSSIGVTISPLQQCNYGISEYRLYIKLTAIFILGIHMWSWAWYCTCAVTMTTDCMTCMHQ